MKRIIILLNLLLFCFLLSSCAGGKNNITGCYENINCDFLRVNSDGTFTVYSEDYFINGTYESSGNETWIFYADNGMRYKVTKDIYDYGIFMSFNDENYLFFEIEDAPFEEAVNAISEMKSILYTEQAWERIVKNDLFDFSVLEGTYSYVDGNNNEMRFEVKDATGEHVSIEFEDGNLQEHKLQYKRCDYDIRTITYDPEGNVLSLETKANAGGAADYGISYSHKGGLTLFCKEGIGTRISVTEKIQ